MCAWCHSPPHPSDRPPTPLPPPSGTPTSRSSSPATTCAMPATALPRRAPPVACWPPTTRRSMSPCSCRRQVCLQRHAARCTWRCGLPGARRTLALAEQQAAAPCEGAGDAHRPCPCLLVACLRPHAGIVIAASIVGGLVLGLASLALFRHRPHAMVYTTVGLQVRTRRSGGGGGSTRCQGPNWGRCLAPNMGMCPRSQASSCCCIDRHSARVQGVSPTNMLRPLARRWWCP